MISIPFDEKIIDHFKNIMSESIQYANNEVDKILSVNVYISFEWIIFFNVFFRLNNNELYKKHKINAWMKDVDTSAEKQRSLNRYCNSELAKIKDLFIRYNREIPTQIKIIYSPNGGNFESKFSYEKHHNDELFIGDDSLANDWFQELQKENKADGI